MTVATNTAAIVGLGNPRRLSNFEGSGLDKVKRVAGRRKRTQI